MSERSSERERERKNSFIVMAATLIDDILTLFGGFLTSIVWPNPKANSNCLWEEREWEKWRTLAT
jgi:hypothetical protein